MYIPTKLNKRGKVVGAGGPVYVLLNDPMVAHRIHQMLQSDGYAHITFKGVWVSHFIRFGKYAGTKAPHNRRVKAKLKDNVIVRPESYYIVSIQDEGIREIHNKVKNGNTITSDEFAELLNYLAGFGIDITGVLYMHKVSVKSENGIHHVDGRKVYGHFHKGGVEKQKYKLILPR